ncbi:MAG: nitrile hydratase accessory protein [Kiloniellales bacterium]
MTRRDPPPADATPKLPRDPAGEPVFAEPWQAQAFALAVKLEAEGHFTWPEWSQTLGEEIKAAQARGDPDDGSTYYNHWLAALRRMIGEKGLASEGEIQTRKAAWAEAYAHTPHGRPVELKR